MDPNDAPCQVPLDAPVSRHEPRGSTRRLGSAGEQLAADHLVESHDCQVLDRNWRIAQGELRGELDVIAWQASTATLVVCEVKTRRDAHRFGGAVAAVSPRKRAQVRRITAAYLRQARVAHRGIRLDVIAVDLGDDATLTHYAGVL